MSQTAFRNDFRPLGAVPPPPPVAAIGGQIVAFGHFRMHRDRKIVLSNGVPLLLGGRAFDILEFLIENRDRFVCRDEILAQVWRGLTVGDNNLSVQMSILRRRLASHDDGEPVIVSVPGHGYRFVGQLLTQDRDQDRSIAAKARALQLLVSLGSGTGRAIALAIALASILSLILLLARAGGPVLWPHVVATPALQPPPGSTLSDGSD